MHPSGPTAVRLDAAARARRQNVYLRTVAGETYTWTGRRDGLGYAPLFASAQFTVARRMGVPPVNKPPSRPRYTSGALPPELDPRRARQSLPPELDPRRSRQPLPPELDPRRPLPPRQLRRRSRHPVLRGLAIGLSALVLLVSVGGYAAYRFYDAQLTRIGIRLPGQGAVADTDGAAQNFVLAGSDSRSFAGGQAFQAAPGSADYVTGQRSDTVILVHIPAGSGKPTVVSFPRDSYVQIPGYADAHGVHHDPYMAKLNEAFSVGGPALLVQLIENLSGLKVDHYVQVDFGGFRTMVNALGGVTLCVRTTRHDHDSGDMLTAGVHPNVNGDVALSFVRDRKGLPNGDLDRIRDQQYFLAQVLHKVLSAGTLANPFKLNAFLSAVASNVTVDSGFGLNEMRTLATRLRHLDPGHVTFATVPITSEAGTAVIHGVSQSVVLLDQPKLAAMFAALRHPAPVRHTIAGKRLAPSKVTVTVLNGTQTNGLAAHAAAVLRADGFVVAHVGNAAAPAATTTVRYAGAGQDAANTVAAVVPAAQVQTDPSQTGGPTSVTLVIGPDYTGVTGARHASSSSSASSGAKPPAAAAAPSGPSCAP